jgi:hypothetical protein
MTLQTFSLFNQRNYSKAASLTWRGDWIFRRERLALIERELKNIKPDILILQEIMEKRSSSSDSDQSILSFGSLRDYDWHLRKHKFYSDTFEEESLGVAVGLPLRIDKQKSLGEKELWPLGTKSSLMLTVVHFEDQLLLVANLYIQGYEALAPPLYDQVTALIQARLDHNRLCNKRLVLAGFMVDEIDSASYQRMLTDLQLKDSSQGFCAIESRCYTATPTNEMFRLSSVDQRPSRSDRILVPTSAIVQSSTVNMKEPKPSHAYVKQFGLANLWPGPRFGQAATVRFARCD